MRRRDVVLHTIEFCFGQVIAGAVAPHRLQREAGERVVIVSGEHPDPLTVLPCNRVRQDSRGVEGVAGLLQDLPGPRGVSVLHQIKVRSLGIVSRDLRSERNRPPEGALGLRVSTQQTVGLPEVEEERMAARVKLRGSDKVAHCFRPRSEEHTSELQSRENLVCRLLLEKKKKRKTTR